MQQLLMSMITRSRPTSWLRAAWSLHIGATSSQGSPAGTTLDPVPLHDQVTTANTPLRQLQSAGADWRAFQRHHQTGLRAGQQDSQLNWGQLGSAQLQYATNTADSSSGWGQPQQQQQQQHVFKHGVHPSSEMPLAQLSHPQFAESKGSYSGASGSGGNGSGSSEGFMSSVGLAQFDPSTANRQRCRRKTPLFQVSWCH